MYKNLMRRCALLIALVLSACSISPQPEPELGEIPLVHAIEGNFGGNGECIAVCALSYPPMCYGVCDTPGEPSCNFVSEICVGGDSTMCSTVCIDESVDEEDCPNIVTFHDEDQEQVQICVLEE